MRQMNYAPVRNAQSLQPMALILTVHLHTDSWPESDDAHSAAGRASADTPMPKTVRPV